MQIYQAIYVYERIAIADKHFSNFHREAPRHR